jgi:hypothetical protein
MPIGFIIVLYPLNKYLITNMQLQSLLNYAVNYHQPLIGLFVGILLLIFVATINWAGNIKPRTVSWLARKIYRNSHKSIELADGLFMVLTTYLLIAGLFLVFFAYVFLAAK